MAERLARITERRDNTDGEWVRREVVERKLAFALSSENHAVSRPRRVCAGTKSISIYSYHNPFGGIVIYYPEDWELDLARKPPQDDLRDYVPVEAQPRPRSTTRPMFKVVGGAITAIAFLGMFVLALFSRS